MKEIETIASKMKDLLSDPKNRIKLDDFVTDNVKKFIEATRVENFPVQGNKLEASDFTERVGQYEKVVKDMQAITILLARWGDAEQLLLLEKVFIRLSETDKGSAGLTVWIHLGWYPLQILMYSAGIAALSAKKFDALKIVLMTPVPVRTAEDKLYPVIIPVVANLGDTNNQWKWLPGLENRHVPRSDHLFDVLRDSLNELLFLEKSYETLFDDFEIYSSLAYSDATNREWGPIGRFGWKHDRGAAESPFVRVIETGKKEGKSWGPLRAGLFGGTQERFSELAQSLSTLLGKINWF